MRRKLRTEQQGNAYESDVAKGPKPFSQETVSTKNVLSADEQTWYKTKPETVI